MAPKKQRRRRYCPVKTRNGIRWKPIFKNRNEAHRALQESRKARETWGIMEEGQPSKPKRAYKCRQCGKFHLTKLPKTLTEEEEYGRDEEDDGGEDAGTREHDGLRAIAG